MKDHFETNRQPELKITQCGTNSRPEDSDEFTQHSSLADSERVTLREHCIVTNCDRRDRGWFSTAKSGDEQVSLKAHVEYLTGD